MSKLCKECGIYLNPKRFKKDRRLLCKHCNNKRILKYINKLNRKKINNIYYLYYLPEEHYIGITNSLKRRMSVHRTQKNKITEGWEIIAEYTDPKLCALHEALMHYIGYNGSAYDNMLKSKKNNA